METYGIATSCTINNNVIFCIECIKIIYDEFEESDFDTNNQCGNCKIHFGDELFYNCNYCGKGFCSVNCVKLTGCQTRSCICHQCFDRQFEKGKCINCRIGNISVENIYLQDDFPSPYCGNC